MCIGVPVVKYSHQLRNKLLHRSKMYDAYNYFKNKTFYAHRIILVVSYILV